MITISKALAILAYVACLFLIAFFSYRRKQTSADFVIGGRSMNYFLTALAAHASDMSSWLLMGYPAVIYSKGLFQSWIAVGLLLFMFLNWHFIAPRLRKVTESYQSTTLSNFFESRFHDTSGLLRMFTALALLFYYTIYISAGLTGLGLLIESIFGYHYLLGISLGILIVIPYLLFGGYITLAWTDLFQGLFLMIVCLFVPFFIIYHFDGSFSNFTQMLSAKSINLSLIPHANLPTFFTILGVVLGWGLGYFGQPHILTKFMGIRDVKEMKKAKYVGLTWQAITLSAATLIGLVSITFYQTPIQNAELVFVNMVGAAFPTFIATFILCAIFAATISTMDSQILVLASSLSEDIYKRLLHKEASSKALIFVSRISIILVALLAYFIAAFRFETIFGLVIYAWAGLGSTFGPAVIASLYSKSANRYGIASGVAIGAGISAVAPAIFSRLSIDMPSIIPGFLFSSLSIWLVSRYTNKTISP